MYGVSVISFGYYFSLTVFLFSETYIYFCSKLARIGLDAEIEMEKLHRHFSKEDTAVMLGGYNTVYFN